MGQIETDNININLLWTGGWDSTFQLLRLLLIYKVRVTPFYIIDESRSSTLMEIKAISMIKNHLITEYPHVKELMKATQYHAVTNISHNKNISDSYRSLQKKVRVGIQYEWLARFCFEKDIQNMQLSVEDIIIPSPTDFFSNYITPFLKLEKIGNQEVYLLDPKIKSTDQYKVFKYFSFPIIKLTKLQSIEIVNKKGWMKIMEMTWFCHNPTRHDEPCGYCAPCSDYIEDFFGWRIPAGRRYISYYYRNFVNPFKSKLRSYLISTRLLADKNKV
ncbi:MAG: hypothetical protein GY908_10720 [Flavobacteriales bacterium]|nr:hypothetical protein [Flavobacteriales bacterium]